MKIDRPVWNMRQLRHHYNVPHNRLRYLMPRYGFKPGEGRHIGWLIYRDEAERLFGDKRGLS